jgi:putative flippase GtrA
VTRKKLTIHANLFTRYFLLALAILGIQFTTTIFATSVLHQTKLVAALISIAVGVFLNWRYASRLIFGESKHHPMLEFFLSALIVVSGLGMQLLTAKLAVAAFNVGPFTMLATVLSLGAIWNYALLKKIVFKL